MPFKRHLESQTRKLSPKKRKQRQTAKMEA
nr:MAG TPA: hypothetical protein [Caudoviricetes sp.]